MTSLANRGTRLKICISLGVFVSLCYVVGVFGMVAGLPTFDQWAAFIQWDFGIYALSEVGGKSAEAYRDRGTTQS